MKLQAKVMLIIGACWLAICIIVFADSKFVIARNYQKLEETVIHHEIADTQRAFDRMLYSLSLYTLAWAQWDEAYDFMKVKSQKFIDSNFVSGTYTSSKINFFIFFDTTGHFYFGQSYNATTNKTAPPPAPLLDYLSINKQFVTHQSVTSSKVGILNTKIGLIVMSSLPVIKGNGTGPVRGTLLMGYYLNNTHFDSLSQIVGMKVEFLPISTVLQNKQLYDSYLQLTSGEKYAEAVVSPKLEYGFFLLKDINNNPIGLVRITIPRMIYQEGLSTTYHYFIIVLLLGIVVMLLMWGLFKLFVLNRVISISDQISKIDFEKQFDQKINISGHDELASMVFIFNDMLKMISNSQRQLRYLASHDALTRLPNREHFYELLNQAIVKTKKNKTKLAIMFLDMDKLKSVNDKYGHSVGDIIIKNAANRIKQSIRHTDIVGRQSGDEFILFLQDIQDINIVTDTAKRILQTTSAPYFIDNISITISFSIGISIYPDDGTGVEELIKHADDVMYSTKIRSGNDFEYYKNKAALMNEKQTDLD